MAIYKNSEKIGDVYKDNIKIAKIYKGNTLIYKVLQNVFDGQLINGLYAYKDGSFTPGTNYVCSLHKLEVLPDTHYRITINNKSFINNLDGGILYYGADNSYINYAYLNGVYNNTFDTPDNTTHITFNLTKKDGTTISPDEFNNIKITLEEL